MLSNMPTAGAEDIDAYLCPAVQLVFVHILDLSLEAVTRKAPNRAAILKNWKHYTLPYELFLVEIGPNASSSLLAATEKCKCGHT